MKATLCRSALILATLAARCLAQEPAGRISDDNPAAQKPSAPVAASITAALPKYDPTPAPAAPAEPKPGDPVKPVTPEDIARAANPDNADLLVLPKMTVKQRPRPRLTPEVVFTKQQLGSELAKKKFSELDQILNKFTLPLFGTSLASQALEDYQREKNIQMRDDVKQISGALDKVDPAEAKALREAAAKP
jgi:hypothetical protein